MPKKPVVRNAVIDALLSAGPMSTVEIAAHLGWPRHRVDGVLSMSRMNHPGQYFKIVRFELQIGRSGREIPIYAAGAGADAKRPTFDAAYRADYARNYHKRNRAKRAAQRKARISAIPAGPWDAFMHSRIPTEPITARH